MLMLLMMSMIIFMIVNIMMMIVNLISKKTFKDREKTSPFECGFDPKNSARLPFSLQFFLIAMIFLIFDIEITLIIPFLFTINLTNIFTYSSLIFWFILILLIGLYHEWNQGALNWKI
uniref:NADH-ubiquinone oxidoreductase chain 3 n=1 Tax=Nephus oblongosignatus TaxID=2772058 RepID=A0A7H1DNN5_9CUCU|nr:NADH dehydrogenase subunit 3 [Nephus oblongosignatus]QNS38580.1 NADH dehydrogenase subunit 3 [Nephus oblongosignatus]